MPLNPYLVVLDARVTLNAPFQRNRPFPINLVRLMVDALQRRMLCSEEYIFRFIEDWYRGGASAAEQDHFDTDSAYRERLINTFQEQMVGRSNLVRDIAGRVSAMAGRPYGQALAIALNFVDHILDRQQRLLFDRDFQFRIQVQTQICRMLIDSPPLDSNEESPARLAEEEPPDPDKENQHPNHDRSEYM